MFNIKLSRKMKAFFGALEQKVQEGAATVDERKLYKEIYKALKLLSENPKHPSLASHKIEALKERYGQDVWESYLENRAPGARRLFWQYGPERGEITVLLLERHPENARDYWSIKP